MWMIGGLQTSINQLPIYCVSFKKREGRNFTVAKAWNLDLQSALCEVYRSFYWDKFRTSKFLFSCRGVTVMVTVWALRSVLSNAAFHTASSTDLSDGHKLWFLNTVEASFVSRVRQIACGRHIKFGGVRPGNLKERYNWQHLGVRWRYNTKMGLE